MTGAENAQVILIMKREERFKAFLFSHLTVWNMKSQLHFVTFFYIITLGSPKNR